MARYEIGLRTSGVAITTPQFELRSVTRRLRLLEIGGTLQAATASTLGLGRPAAVGTGGTNNAVVASDGNDATALALAILATWTAAPTAPASFLRRWGLPATIGSSFVFTPVGLFVPVGGSLVLWNLAANGIMDIWCAIEEQ